MAQVFTWGLEGRRMSEETATATATDELKLTPPEPVPSVSPEKAAGLVPLSTDQKSKLGERVDGFIDEIGSAHVCTPVTNAQLVCRLLLETKKKQLYYIYVQNRTRQKDHKYSTIYLPSI